LTTGAAPTYDAVRQSKSRGALPPIAATLNNC
jgi:hypothetical protein